MTVVAMAVVAMAVVVMVEAVVMVAVVMATSIVAVATLVAETAAAGWAAEPRHTMPPTYKSGPHGRCECIDHSMRRSRVVGGGGEGAAYRRRGRRRWSRRRANMIIKQQQHLSGSSTEAVAPNCTLHSFALPALRRTTRVLHVHPTRSKGTAPAPIPVATDPPAPIGATLAAPAPQEPMTHTPHGQIAHVR